MRNQAISDVRTSSLELERLGDAADLQAEELVES